jgi:hypothetical protein
MRGQEMDAVITFRANARLPAEAEALAASEGISRSDAMWPDAPCSGTSIVQGA